MAEDLASMSVEALQKVLATERAKKTELIRTLTSLELTIQESSRMMEQREEGLMRTTDKRIRELKVENCAVAMRIDREEDYLKGPLTRAYEAVLREREELRGVIDKQEVQVNGMLEQRIHTLCEELAHVQEITSSEAADEKLADLYRRGTEAKAAYQVHLESLNKETDELIEANNAMLAKIGPLQLQLMTDPEKLVRSDMVDTCRRYSDIPTRRVAEWG